MTRSIAHTVLALAIGLAVAAGCSDRTTLDGGRERSRTLRKGDVTSKGSTSTGPSKRTDNSRIDDPSRRLENRQIVDRTFDDLKFEMERNEVFDRSMLTPAIEEMDGRRIRIRGYIRPTAQRRGIRRFILVRDNMECCFGPGAALCDCIVVNMTPGRTTEFSIRPVTIEGRFTISELIGPGDKHLAVFKMVAETVR